MLQRLLTPSSDPAREDGSKEMHEQVVPSSTDVASAALRPRSPSRNPPGTRSACVANGGSGGVELVPGGVEQLLTLELEVVQLQQSLQIAQLEFETRTVQLHSLKQRADDAELRAQAAEERASDLVAQVRQLERQVSELRCQLAEAAAQHQREVAQHATRLAAATAARQAAEQQAAQQAALLAAATSTQQAAQQEAMQLRQQLAAARHAADEEQARLRGAAARQEAEVLGQAAALRRENEQLRAQLTAASIAPKAVEGHGCERATVSGQALQPAAGAPSGMQSPPDSPRGAQQPQQVAPPSQLRRPAVPRLHLSCISLEQLQARASPKPQVGTVLAGAKAAGHSPVGSSHAQQWQQQGFELPSAQQDRHQHSQAGGTDHGFSHVMVAADGTAALSGLPGATGAPSMPRPQQAQHGVIGACGTLGEAAPSPHSSVQQNCDAGNLPPLPPALRSTSAAQQELLATARQWQQSARSARATAAAAGEVDDEVGSGAAHCPPPLPSSRGSARGPGPALLHGGGGAACGHRAGGGHAAPRQETPWARAGGGSLPGTPGRRPGLRRTYGQEPGFQEIREAYDAVLSSGADRDARWARSVFSSASAVDCDPGRVDHMVQGLLQLCASNGVPIPLRKCGPCQYRLGAAKLALRLVNGRLMARASAGQTMDIFSWLEKQPLPPPAAGPGTAQHAQRSPLRY